MSLTFDPTKYEVHTLELDGKTLVYRSFEDISYIENPVIADFQKLNVYVPEAFYADESDVQGKGIGVGAYTISNAPIFLPNTVGGYMPGPRELPGVNQFMGGPNTTFMALLRGYAVVSPGVRGRGQKSSDGKNLGVAPADICDLKAAVRFIRHNASVIPGDTEKIISNGTSAGGAMSSLQGSTGNHADYEPYLKEMGAADERDDVFASSCYCPITNLDHADMAYEWEFNGINDYHRTRMIPPTEKGGKPTFEPVDGEMTETQCKLSDELKPLFPEYFNSLGLTDEDGTPLTLDTDGSGNFVDYILRNVLASAQKELDKGTDLAADEKVTAWLTIEDGKAVSADWKGYVAFRTRMKQTPAFDSVTLGTPETELFGTADIFEKHFSEFSAAHDEAGAQLADSHIIKMMNPMNYIDDPQATKAQHFRIRHGAVDRDTSLAISNMLVFKLKNAGIDAQLAHPWEIPHAGDYDLDELFAWIDEICA